MPEVICQPKILTAIPGPKSNEYLHELGKTFDTQNATLVANYEASSGVWLVDIDGNVMLDAFAQIASIPLGYNNPSLVQACKSEAMVSAMVNRPAMGVFPQHDWNTILQAGILKAAPLGLDKVFTSMTGSDANETAYKAAFMWKRARQRGPGRPFTDAELESCLNNATPGSPNMSIMSFSTGFHGRLFGSLSTTHSKAIHKLDIPAFDWPQCKFPKLKYPLDQHHQKNVQEEAECLAEAERIVTTYHNEVAAIVVEPIQSEGGDNHASPQFFQQLRNIAKKHDVLFIVDEVQTGMGATGKLWAHEHWELDDAPDIVTFSKKAQAAGFFYHDPKIRPSEPFRQFNTWMGDPAKALLFQAILEEIRTKDLLNQVTRVGNYLYKGLEHLAMSHPLSIFDLRGKDRGTFIAFNTSDRDAFVRRLRNSGVNVGASGPNGVRLRPMLILQEEHADIILSAIKELL
jgi:4-aminobutyrate aminotransferase/(S)-3-amino-2-methylpropionate transaminase